jgi:hypothetical protein
MSLVTRVADYINSTLFTIEPKLTADRLPRAFRLLVKLIELQDETDWSYGGESYASLDSLIVGAYWYFSENYAGQASEEYETLCTLGRIFSPGMTSGPEEESSELDVYNALVELFENA